MSVYDSGRIIILKLAHDPDFSVRRSVASREDMPDDLACDIMDLLSRDENWFVRFHVAKNRSIPQECAEDVLERLHGSGDVIIQAAVESNPLWAKCRGGR